MKLVSVIIPTHNRTKLLIEAISSIEAQSYRYIEIIVVDDASEVPLIQNELQEHSSFPIKLLRNNKPESSIWCRNRGVAASRGDLIMNLDDDDLYAPNAVESVVKEFSIGRSDKIVFMGVEGFGRRADDFNKTQALGVEKAIKGGKGKKLRNDSVAFSRELLPYLLSSVPSAFQRVATTRENWEQVTALRNRTYMIDPTMDYKRLKEIIRPPLRDSEWSIYAAALFESVLINNGLYRFRCDGQNGISKPELMRDSITSQLSTLLNIYRNGMSFSPFKTIRGTIKKEISNCYFSLAYYDHKKRYNTHIKINAWKSFTFSVEFRCVKLLAITALVTFLESLKLEKTSLINKIR